MAISGIGYTQTYYYNASTGKFTSKDKGGEAIADSLNEETSQVRLADFEKQQKSLLETFLRMQGQTGINLSKGFTVNGTKFKETDGQLSVEGAFAEGSKVWEREAAWRRGAMKELLRDEFGLSDEMLETEMEKYPSAVPKKGEGGPYSYLADENGIIEYNGVIFSVNKEKNWLCLGDVSNLDHVIRIPLSEGGCLMVNRDCIGSLGRAIGMFSPEDINRILRALKMDAKIQEMKKEVEEMEDGIGKSNDQQYADSAEAAEKAAKENGNAGGFNGYGLNGEEEGTFKLKDWQLALLLGEEEDGGAGAWYGLVPELAGQREEERNERYF